MLTYYRLLPVGEIMKCRNCGERIVRKNPCPYCGEANWTDERHQRTMDGDVYG